MYQRFKEQLNAFYDRFSLNKRKPESLGDREAMALRDRIGAEMDAFYQENPEMPAILLKSRLHTLTARYFEPVIFSESPFFFEMGLRERCSWGISIISPATWMTNRIGARVATEHPLSVTVEKQFDKYFDREGTGLCHVHRSFDNDHHSLGYTRLFAEGINGILARLQTKMVDCVPESEAYAFCAAAKESCEALLTIAQRFGDKASQMLLGAQSVREKRFLQMISEAAKNIPAKAPATFYEGLAMLLFTREVIGTLENIGVSQFGHVDRLLGPLYEKDLAAGRITEVEARELIDLWMLYTDVKFALDRNPWPETSTCIELGGSDEMGETVYNDVTRLFIEEQMKLRLVNPKFNCRYSAHSPEAYLRLVGKAIAAGRNSYALINDDVLIKGLMCGGVEERDARLYLNGGCQETIIEGCGHTEGAAVYISLPRILDAFLRYDSLTDIIKPVARADSFEDFYAQFIQTLKTFLNTIVDQRNFRQQFNKETMYCPLFSATQQGCIENGRDYTHGGGKYNFSTLSLVGLGTLTDALYAVKRLVYDEKRVTLEELNAILAADWEGNETLRRVALALPKYGHNQPEPDCLAGQLMQELTHHVRGLKNERGGSHIPSFFTYYYFSYFCAPLRATPDGRKNGDLMSMGCGPGRLVPIADVTKPLKSMMRMNFKECAGGIAVLDVKLPASSGLNEDVMAAFIRAAVQSGCPSLQINVVSPEELLDAKIHPELHRDLTVRISGLSALFVSLTPKVQDEIIARENCHV